MIMHDLTELSCLRTIWRITVWNEWNGQLDLRPESDRTSLGLSTQRGCCFKSSSKGRYMSSKQGFTLSGLRFLFRCPTT
ncbi:hypothetical protein TNCV_2955171 [Trichonephila clavipes]|nr:hypothetical protein TNCV_2955171 [Trichonephila clavipes]